MENMKKKMFGYFEEISKIPRGSGNTDGITKYLVGFAEDHGLWYRTDESNNVIMKKPASPGYENAEPIIIQGHTDMVCEKTADCQLNMKTDGLILKTDGDWLYAEGTTLGGDDGIAVAMALALLDSEAAEHPALECLFTTDEEVGMMGARALDMSDIRAKKLINIDSEEEGLITVSCAGGANAEVILPVEFKEAGVCTASSRACCTDVSGADSNKATSGACCTDVSETGSNKTTSETDSSNSGADNAVLNIVIDGLTGGHSGIMIIKERANSNVLMGRLLSEISKGHKISLISIGGGKVGNVICKKTEAKIVVCADEVDEIKKEIAGFEAQIKHEFAATDPEMTIAVSAAGTGAVSGTDAACDADVDSGADPASDANDTADAGGARTAEKNGAMTAERISAMTSESTQRIITWLMTAPNGIQNMSAAESSAVETSLNLGAVITEFEGEVKFVYTLRSTLTSRKEFLKDKLRYLAGQLSGTASFEGDFPGWEYLSESPLREATVKAFVEQYGYEPEIISIHAGLECGLFAEKIGEGFDAISIGPDLPDVHTPDERMSISSAERTFDLLCGILKKCR